MTIIGIYGGPVGLGVSGVYFIGKTVYDNRESIYKFGRNVSGSFNFGHLIPREQFLFNY